MENKTQEYYPLVNNTKPFHIQDTSGAVYRKLKMLMLKSPSLQIVEKAAIGLEFRLYDSSNDGVKKFYEDISKKQIDISKYYEELVKILFIDSPAKVEFDNINIAQVNKALHSFFESLKVS